MVGIEPDADQFHRHPLRRVVAVLVFCALLGVFLLWRIEGERMEWLRAKAIDALVPSLEIGTRPGEIAFGAADAAGRLFGADERIALLEEEVKALKAWREYARALEQENARLRGVANVRSLPYQVSFSAEVLADASGYFTRSVLVNAGAANGVVDGWPATDGFGLVGRISGVGDAASRIILLTDANSRVPVSIEPSGTPAIASGDNSQAPILELVQDGGAIALGDRVVTSGDGGVFPRGLLVGTVTQGADRSLRIKLAADFRKLAFVSILKTSEPYRVESGGSLVVGGQSAAAGP